MIKVVIFDMDGLLTDSQPAWYEAIKEFLFKRKLKYTPSMSNRVMGSGHRETIKLFKKQMGLKGDTEGLVLEMREHFFRHFMQEPEIMDGVKELLEFLKGQKYALSVATSTAPRSKVIEIFKALRIKNYFKAITTGDEIAKGKPDPQIYILTAKKLGVKPSDCLVLEDAVNGVISGKAAGMKVYGVNKDEEIRGELEEAGADKVFTSLLRIKI